MESGVQGKGPEFGSCQQNVHETTCADRERPMKKAVGQISICSWWRRGEANSSRKDFKLRNLDISNGVSPSLSI